MLYILLDNASKYAPPHSTIRVTASLAADGQVELSVADEGPGHPGAARANRSSIASSACPARQSYDPRRKGIGLGLSIARRLVEAQGGRIWIDGSRRQDGRTTSRLTLPSPSARRRRA